MSSPRLRDGIPVLGGSLPIVGHVLRLYRGLDEVTRRARETLGPVYWANAAGSWFVVCSGEEALRAFRDASFTSTHLQTIAPIVAGQSLLSQDGAFHRRMRSAINKPLLPRGLTASGVGAIVADVLGALVSHWMVRGSARVLPEIQEAALEVMFRLLGVEPSELSAWRVQYRRLLLANLNIKLRFPGSPAVRSEKARAWIDGRLRGLVKRARDAKDTATFLGALSHAEDDDGVGLSDDELVDNLRLLVLGGHETISATMAWMAIAVASRPDVWASLRTEAAGAAGVPTTPDQARAFPFAEALFRETVRVHPPFGMITRKTTEAVRMHGLTIPKGAIVAVDLRSIAHDGALFPEPEELRPSRWLELGRTPTPVELSQFGAGPHFCVGYHLAWLEGVVFAVALARAAVAANRRPQLDARQEPKPIFLPTEHPPPGTRIRFVAG